MRLIDCLLDQHDSKAQSRIPPKKSLRENFPRPPHRHPPTFFPYLPLSPLAPFFGFLPFFSPLRSRNTRHRHITSARQIERCGVRGLGVWDLGSGGEEMGFDCGGGGGKWDGSVEGGGKRGISKSVIVLFHVPFSRFFEFPV